MVQGGRGSLFASSPVVIAAIQHDTNDVEEGRGYMRTDPSWNSESHACSVVIVGSVNNLVLMSLMHKLGPCSRSCLLCVMCDFVVLIIA